MRTAKNIVLAFLLLAAASLPAAAQDAYGKFTVTHETRWGSAVLPAGSYSVSLRSGVAPFVIVTSDTSAAFSIMVVAQYVDTAQCKTSSLELEQNVGTWDVRSLCFASSVSVHFSSPDKLNHVLPAVPQVASISGSN